MDEYSTEGQYGIETKRRKFWKDFFKILLIALVSSVLTVSALAYKGYIALSPEPSVKLKETVLNESVQGKIAQVIGIMEHYYYEDIDQVKLTEGVYRGMVNSLEDPYSMYFTAEEYTNYKASATGKYYGIGAVLSQDVKSRMVSIVRAYEGTPAFEVGLKAGDFIVSVDGVDATSMELTEFVNHIRGDEGTSIHMIIVREGEEIGRASCRERV